MKLHHLIAVVKLVPDLFGIGLLLSFSLSTTGVGCFLVSTVSFSFVVPEKFSPTQSGGKREKSGKICFSSPSELQKSILTCSTSSFNAKNQSFIFTLAQWRKNMCKVMQACMFSALKGIVTSFDRRGIQFTEEMRPSYPSSAKTDMQP